MISYIVCHVGMICASTVLLSTRTREFALTLASDFAGCLLYPPCSSGKAFCFPGLSGMRPIFLKLKAELCASTVLLSTRTREFALTQPLYSDARLRLCWVLTLFAVLVRESFQLSRTVGHSPYRLKSAKSALCKHSTFFLFQPARLIAYAHYIIFPYIYTTTTLQKVFLSVN